ncbi:MAG: metal ABC transporter substrate-binding protein, partial [Eubacteriales bacterium]|nr:metal ABC transporter substrate-binding protein [Eubacteriales bacterium]
MKKIITSLMIILMVVGAMTACSQNNSDNNNDGKKLSIVCTIFPEYDWVKQILGDHLENTDLTMLLDNGVDLHSYQPTTDDIVKISNCDMFIYVGGESDSWVEDALKEATNKNMVVINLLDFLGDTVKEEEVIQGMEGEHAEGEHAEEEDPEYDEHVWLSLKNASTLTSFISEKLGEIDEKNAADYKANGTSYIKQLD